MVIFPLKIAKNYSFDVDVFGVGKNYLFGNKFGHFLQIRDDFSFQIPGHTDLVNECAKSCKP